MERIETERLVLRKARKEDTEAIWKNVWSDESLTEMMLWNVTETYDEAVKRMERTIAYQKDHPVYFIALKQTDEPIGFAGIFELQPGIYEDRGICICRKCQHKGYGREAVAALINYAFTQLNGKGFVYSLFSNNEPSKALCLSLGFEYVNSSDEVRERDGYEYVVDYYFLSAEHYYESRAWLDYYR